ncbi:MAG: hypothetical protein NVSMB1_26850 [Polyangiales bacterium]
MKEEVHVFCLPDEQTIEALDRDRDPWCYCDQEHPHGDILTVFHRLPQYLVSDIFVCLECGERSDSEETIS